MDFVNWLKSQRDRVVAWTLIAIGGLCILGGWFGVTHTVDVYNQLTYLVSGAIVGLFFLGVGAVLVLSADFHDEWRKLDRIETLLRGRHVPDVDEVLDLVAQDGEADTRPDGSDVRRSGGVPETVMMASVMPAGGALAALPLRRELAWALPGLAVAVALITISWTKSTTSTDARVGEDAVLIAVLGVFACGFGVALHSRWLRQALARRKAQLLGPFLRTGVAVEARAAVVDDDTLYVTAGGGQHYHQARCAIVASQKAVVATPAQVQHLVACELCHDEGLPGS